MSFIEKAHHENCDIVVFPECSLWGYSPMDLLESTDLVKKQWQHLEKLEKKLPKNLGVFLGAISINSKDSKTKKLSPLNSAVFLQKGKKPKIFSKQLLPNYDVFHEDRHMKRGDIKKNILSFKKKRFLVTVCEDIWGWPDKDGHRLHQKNPLLEVDKKSFDGIINLSASPFYSEKQKDRLWVTQKTTQYFKAPLIYSNLVGGQDDLIFDGSSFVMNNKGVVVYQGKSFSEDFFTFNLSDLSNKDLPHSKHTSRKKPTPTHQLRQALVLGIRDFVTKNNFKNAHLGLSGGIDSAVVLCLLVEALGAKNVRAIGLPSPFNHPKSLSVAKKMAHGLEVKWMEIPIEKTFNLMVKTLEDKAHLGAFNLVHENLQARIRGTFLMALANQWNSLLIATGNKTEFATGYSTLYGDMCGGLAPIGDLLKSQVYDLARSYNQETDQIPPFIIERAPSAELRESQKDEDSLPPYNLLDKAVEKLVTHQLTPRGKIENWTHEALIKSEFKRRQAPPILKVSKRSFGLGRRMPITVHS